MTDNSTIVRYTASEARALRASSPMRSLEVAPEADNLPDGFWDNALVVAPPGKTLVRLSLEDDVVEWFRDAGEDYLAKMSAALRSYVESQTKKEQPRKRA